MLAQHKSVVVNGRQAQTGIAPALARTAPRQRLVCTSAASKTKSKVGFRWDVGMNRWMRDDRLAELAGDEDATLITPKSGLPYKAWPVIHTTLMEAGLKTIEPAEAQALTSRGWVILDVRLADDFDKQHAEGAVNVPLYRLTAGNSLWDNIKKVSMAGLNMKATERDPEFVNNVLKVMRKNSKVLLMCSIGGTLDTEVSYRREKKIYKDPERAFGRESRSLKAAYELLEGGWSPGNVQHVKGGFPQWRYDGLPTMEG